MDVRPRCDSCGRFVRPGSPGSSWVMVPDFPPMSFGDEIKPGHQRLSRLPLRQPRLDQINPLPPFEWPGGDVLCIRQAVLSKALGDQPLVAQA